jgi:hypothetical protein
VSVSKLEVFNLLLFIKMIVGAIGFANSCNGNNSRDFNGWDIYPTRMFDICLLDSGELLLSPFGGSDP